MSTDEILTVHRFCRDTDGARCVRCPHCGWVIGLERGPIRGEQFQHVARPDCQGWLEVSHDARLVDGAEQLGPVTAAAPTARPHAPRPAS